MSSAAIVLVSTTKCPAVFELRANQQFGKVGSGTRVCLGMCLRVSDSGCVCSQNDYVQRHPCGFASPSELQLHSVNGQLYNHMTCVFQRP